MTAAEQLTFDQAVTETSETTTAERASARPSADEYRARPVQERAGMILAEILPEALAEVGAESFAEIWTGRDGTRRARFLKTVADFFLLDASLDDDYEDEGLLSWLAGIGSATLAEHMVIRAVADESAARRPS